MWYLILALMFGQGTTQGPQQGPTMGTYSDSDDNTNGKDDEEKRNDLVTGETEIPRPPKGV